MEGAVKVGPWGVTSGYPCDINIYSNPQRLVSMGIVFSRERRHGYIYGLCFTYVDRKGDTVTAGTWGVSTIQDYMSLAQIVMNPGEHVNHVSGTVDSGGVTSLKLGTNKTEHGPYGYPAGTEFSLPLQQGKSEVVAFFGNYGSTIRALGVYVLGRKDSPIRVGPWGGYGGFSRDFVRSNMPKQLQSITIRCCEMWGGRIYGFSYTYLDKNGQCIHVGPWGSKTKGHKRVISPPNGDYINFISGTYDDCGVTSLKFISSKDVYGPYGWPTGHTFSVPVSENGSIVSFFGYPSAHNLIGFGAYIAPRDE